MAAAGCTCLCLALLILPTRVLLANGVSRAVLRTTQAEPLGLGGAFPQLEGQTLSGRPITIPSGAARRDSVVVFSFGNEGGKDARLWNERLFREFGSHNGADVVLVLEFEQVPRLIRGLIVSGIKNGVPPGVRDQMMVLENDEALWKARLAVTTTTRSYVVLIDSNGRIKWMGAGPYGEDAFTPLLCALR